jgi:DNA-binding CsgD family transcriptional regulator
LSELTALTEQALADEQDGGEARFESLLPREREIAELVGEGATDVEVAELLDMSLRAARAAVTGLLRKLRLTSRVQLALVMPGHDGSGSSGDGSAQTTDGINGPSARHAGGTLGLPGMAGRDAASATGARAKFADDGRSPVVSR